MSETQTLLHKITALRQRLEQAQGLAREASQALALLSDGEGEPAERLRAAERQVRADSAHDMELDAVVRPLTKVGSDEPRSLPRQLTARARAVLERGRVLLARLRELGEAVLPGEDLSAGPAASLATLYRQTAVLATTALRMVAYLPDTASGQLAQCEGLEALLDDVTLRLHTLGQCLAERRSEEQRIDRLTACVRQIEAGQAKEILPLVELAEELLADAEEGAPLRFLHADVSQRDRSVACHGLTVAQVVARLVRLLPEFRGRQVEPVVAALVHDVGMLRVSPDVLSLAGPLTDEQRRMVESHCRISADLVAPLQSDALWLPQTVLSHHERLDGTGYPDGLREPQLPAPARLLAVCDTYVALCSPRPHRAARETRAAMTETLLLAEQGKLDRGFAEALLQLSFYPVGSVVEMADGSVARVVATPAAVPRRESFNPARPVVALLLDGDGQPYPAPRHLDLAQCDGRSIVRSLGQSERLEKLGQLYPAWI
jgi:HD-GYP domain-containing protein (c-di-GMP phosphodiesterase class II)